MARTPSDDRDRIEACLATDDWLTPWAFPVLTVSLPIVVFAVWIFFVPRGEVAVVPTLDWAKVRADASSVVSQGATPPAPPIAVTNAVTALDETGRLTFMGAHLLTLAVSWLAILAGLEILRRFAFVPLKSNPSQFDQLTKMDPRRLDQLAKMDPERLELLAKMDREWLELLAKMHGTIDGSQIVYTAKLEPSLSKLLLDMEPPEREQLAEIDRSLFAKTDGSLRELILKLKRQELERLAKIDLSQLAKMDGSLVEKLGRTDGSLLAQLSKMDLRQRKQLAATDKSLLEQLAETQGPLLEKIGKHLRSHHHTLRGWIASHETVARLVWHVALCGALWFVFWMGWFDLLVRPLSRHLPFEAAVRFVVSLAGANDLTGMKQTLRATFHFGAQSGLAGAVLLAVAAALIGFRWTNIGVVWYRPEDLARQRSWLIKLFVLASALLVVSAGAIRAGQDWPLGLVDPDVSTAGGRKLAEVGRSVSNGTSSLWGVMSATLLIAAFGPAFYGLSRDIKLAAKIGVVHEKLRASPKESRAIQIVETIVEPRGCGVRRFDLQIDADANAQPAPSGVDTFCSTVAATLRDTTYADIKKWNEDNGLDLSAGQIATALIAAAAPLVASPVIDFAKYVSL